MQKVRTRGTAFAEYSFSEFIYDEQQHEPNQSYDRQRHN